MPNFIPFRYAVSVGVIALAFALVEEADFAQSGAGARGGVNSAAESGALSSRRAEVEYTGGLLHVSANNSSLNQILRDVGRLTGMKITGGVQEDRVFGSYGPAPASQVLAKLLDGTSSNMLIVENDNAGPAELILSPRHGGVTPPNPNAAMAEERDRETSFQQQQVNQQSTQGFFLNGQQGNGAPPPAGGVPVSNGGQTGTPVGGGANLGTTPGAFAGFGQTPQDTTAQPAVPASPSDVSEPQSPNGVSTPQQIYEQLQKLRQQQQQQQTPTPAPQ